ncbi:MAG: DUF1028 domain-containing protein [Planctomycetota bacterium]
MSSSCRFRSLSSCLVLIALAPRVAQATWSIQITDTRTGEVALGAATCLPKVDLKTLLGVVVVGTGTGATQASLPPGSYRKLLFQELLKGTPPYLIIDLMQDLSGHDEDRQFGIADMQRRAATFTGKNTIPWAGGRTGRVGTMTYSVQGNIMVAEAVIAAAEFALIHTKGDVADKLMAGMEAARAQGGDSRCTPYNKSAHVGFMIVARMGDIDAPCANGSDCATGTYYLALDAIGGIPDRDPVLTLGDDFKKWRTSWIGRPDHVQSVAAAEPQRIPADEQATAQLDIALYDWQGVAIPHGGAAITVHHHPTSAGSCSIGTPVDHGDGTYSVPLAAGKIAGEDVFEVVVDDGVSPVTLFPYPSIEVGSALRLRSDVTQVSASLGDDAHFVLQGSTPFAGRSYLLLLSASGTTPGFDDGQVHVPLNFDLTLQNSIMFANVPPLTNTRGALDGNARASAALAPQPGQLDPFVGATLSFAYLTLAPEDFASEPVQVLVVP